jgi:hypothetical protein
MPLLLVRLDGARNVVAATGEDSIDEPSASFSRLAAVWLEESAGRQMFAVENSRVF